jgi:hypothetical protein
MARYLLIVNDYYYPLPSTNDWKGTYDDKESAEEMGKKLVEEDSMCSAYHVIDLQKWLELDPVKT